MQYRTLTFVLAANLYNQVLNPYIPYHVLFASLTTPSLPPSTTQIATLGAAGIITITSNEIQTITFLNASGFVNCVDMNLCN